MRAATRLLLALPLAIGVPAAALAQTDFLTIKKIACAPDRMTRCKSVGVECESKDASPSDKAQLLVIDFENKKVAMRRKAEERPFGLVLEDKVAGDVRTVVLGRGDKPDTKDTLAFTLRKDGKMDGTREEGRIKMETTCVPAG